jgi:hypothetical protein
MTKIIKNLLCDAKEMTWAERLTIFCIIALFGVACYMAGMYVQTARP